MRIKKASIAVVQNSVASIGVRWRKDVLVVVDSPLHQIASQMKQKRQKRKPIF